MSSTVKVEDVGGADGSCGGGDVVHGEKPDKDEGGESVICNVFKIPHSRMMELVSWPLKQAAAVPDIQDMEPTLQAVYEAMWEVKSHEYIENHFIMDDLKARLQARRVYNEQVCNCHEDSVLLEVIGLVENMYTAQTQKERCKYGQKLQKAIRAFLDDFVAHMEEEEAVFQPLLVQNFEPQELAQMNAKVIEQHNFFREKIKEKKLKAVKRKLTDDVKDSNESILGFDLESQLRVKKSYCQEVNDRMKKANDQGSAGEREVSAPKYQKNENEGRRSRDSSPTPFVRKDSPVPSAASPESYIESLPEEILMMMFSHLNPRDLLKASAVCRRWNRVALSSALWQAIYPTQWARGCWSLDYESPDVEKELLKSGSSSLSSSTESLPEPQEGKEDDQRNSSTFTSTSRREDQIFKGIAQGLLPKVGNSITTVILSASRGITSLHIKSILKQVQNVRHVDLSYTNVTAQAFSGLTRFGTLRKLEELNLSGCRFVGDNLLRQLALCFFDLSTQRTYTSHLSKLILSGCRCVTSWGVEQLIVHQNSLQELDLSGCYKVDGQTLDMFVRQCPKLKPQKLSYCNDIEDGPYQETANGCLNLECEVRFCCQNARLIF